jgi:hypothetical protein
MQMMHSRHMQNGMLLAISNAAKIGFRFFGGMTGTRRFGAASRSNQALGGLEAPAGAPLDLHRFLMSQRIGLVCLSSGASVTVGPHRA